MLWHKVQGAGLLGGGWDISTAAFDDTPVNFFAVSLDKSPTDVSFKSDGTKMYVLDDSTRDVKEHNLSTAWDVSTSSYVQAFSVSTQETSPKGLFFKNDGTKMYVIGLTGDDVNEYSLSTAWDISTASYVQNFSVIGEDVSPQDVFFKSDGTKMYVLGDAGNDVNEYNLSTAWDISTASYVTNFSVSAQETTPRGLFFKNDGTKMYVLGDAGDDVNEYSLSTAWDVSSSSYVQSFSLIQQSFSGATPEGLFFKDDGTKMYVIVEYIDTVYQYDLSTAWDISTASFTYPTSDYFSVSTEETTPTGLFFKDDGTKMYIIGFSGDEVNEYNLSTEWNISTASYVQNFSVSTEEIVPQGLFFKNDGTKMYIIGPDGDDVNEYSLSTGWDISTASYSQNFSVSTQETAPTGLFFKPDGTKMYITGSQGNDVNEYSLSTAWDISTASYVQNFSISAQDITPQDLFFKYDGTKMYIAGSNNDKIYEYSLSTSWDISTASYLQDFSVAQQDINLTCLFFKPNGAKMYIAGNISQAIWAYSL